ncbi:MAG: ATP-binding cassette domain-containing protein, partial [Hyphomicrobiaceae bacterium]
MQESRAASGRPSGGPAVTLQGVSIDFAVPGGRYVAVGKTDLAVAAHEFVAIVGPTGCGKSTLLNAAAGLLTPGTGQVLVFGQRLAGLNKAAGYLFQQDAVMPWKTAVVKLAHRREVAGTPRHEALQRLRAGDTRGLKSDRDIVERGLPGEQRFGLKQVAGLLVEPL